MIYPQVLQEGLACFLEVTTLPKLFQMKSISYIYHRFFLGGKGERKGEKGNSVVGADMWVCWRKPHRMKPCIHVAHYTQHT